MYTSSFISDVFTSVASKYDIMNDAMSFGLHRLWKKQFCSLIKDPGAKVLDVATGSGDIAFGLYKKALNLGLTPNIIGVDINPAMLSLAKVKKLEKNITCGLDFIEADSTNLPFKDNSFDYYTISFGIRNIPDISKALQEAHRVLKPCGKFLCMEFGKPCSPGIKQAYNVYSDYFIPKMGGMIAGNKDAYQYLVDSIRAFPDRKKFLSMMQAAGFKISYGRNLNFGVASIYEGYKA